MHPALDPSPAAGQVPRCGPSRARGLKTPDHGQPLRSALPFSLTPRSLPGTRNAARNGRGQGQGPRLRPALPDPPAPSRSLFGQGRQPHLSATTKSTRQPRLNVLPSCRDRETSVQRRRARWPGNIIAGFCAHERRVGCLQILPWRPWPRKMLSGFGPRARSLRPRARTSSLQPHERDAICQQDAEQQATEG